MANHIRALVALVVCLAIASSLRAEPTKEVVAASRQATALVFVPTGFYTGSAFCIHPSGMFITNLHGVRGSGPDRTVKLVINSGTDQERTVQASVIRTDDARDLAVLMAESDDPFPALKLGDDSKLTESMPLVICGFAFDRPIKADDKKKPGVDVAVGSVKSLNAARGVLSRIQFDAEVNGGSSGGPVMNQDGEVVGIVASGVRASLPKSAIPVSKLRDSLDQPVLSFSPPEIEGDDRFKPVDFEIDVTTFAQPRPEFDVDLILGEKPKGNQAKKGAKDTSRTIRAKPYLDGKGYVATASPLPPPADAAPIVVSIRSEGEQLSGMAQDVSLLEGLKLSDIDQLRRSDKGWIVSDHRKLETEFTKLAIEKFEFYPQPGKKMSLDLKKIEELTAALEPYGDVPYYVSLKLKGKEIARRYGKIRVKQAERKIPALLARAGDKQPAAGKIATLPAKPIDTSRRASSRKGPATVQKDKEALTYELPAKYTAYTFGGSGRYIIFRFDTLGVASILDIEQGKIVHEIRGVSPGDMLAANETHLFIVMPAKRLIQKWSFATMEREKMVRIEGGQTPLDALAGAGGQGPLMLIGQRAQLFDPETLKMNVMTGDGVIGGIGNYGYAMCVSANGLTFSGIPVGFGPVAHEMMQVHGNRTANRGLGSTSQALRWAQPTADGHMIFTASSGIYDALGRQLSTDWLDGWMKIPTFDERYFLALRYVENNSKVELAVCTSADRRIIYTESGFKELVASKVHSWNEIVAATKLRRETRVQWLPKSKMLVTLPATNDRVIFRPWDVLSKIQQTGEGYLWISSLPPLEAYNSERLRYQVQVVAKLAKLKYRLEESPQSMTLSDGGLLEWNVPDSFSDDLAPVILTVTDSAGNELIHSFDLKISQKMTEVKKK